MTGMTPEQELFLAKTRERSAKASLRSTLLLAATSCSHTIDREEVILRRDPRLPGNAASQLADRLVAAVMNVANEETK